ncbi:MAG: hypothetical protein NZL92_12220, partial [Gloeomargarita sp. SKYG116]|nr:hypothetical protein [Gloeomargarita sp. SKYG116]MDW8402445.1 hypothetical protein [Gloeomargarita sp. SKYGB_i_bin116]
MRVLADTTGQRYESTYFNNLSNQRAVQYNLFRVRTTADSIVVDENVRIVYDANTFSQNGFVRISREPNPPKVNQPDNVFLRFESQANPSERLAYRIQPYDTTLKLIKPLTMRLRLSPDEPQQARENAAAYFFSAPVERWFKVVEQTRLDSLTIQVQSSRFGAYALMSASDAQRPIVTLGIEGQA